MRDVHESSSEGAAVLNQVIAALGGAGILTQEDIEDFKASERQILVFMAQNEWVSEDQLIDLTGQRQALRRMRALRGPAWDVQKRKVSKRGWEYRLVRKQGVLL